MLYFENENLAMMTNSKGLKITDVLLNDLIDYKLSESK